MLLLGMVAFTTGKDTAHRRPSQNLKEKKAFNYTRRSWFVGKA